MASEMYGLGHQNSALHNANVDTEDLRVRSNHSVWVCLVVRRSWRKPKSGHVELFLIWEGTRGQILCQVGIGGRLLPDERKRSIIMDRQNWFSSLAKDASKTVDRRTVLTRVSTSSGVEETINDQD